MGVGQHGLDLLDSIENMTRLEMRIINFPFEIAQ